VDQADGDGTLTDGRGNAFHRPVPDIATAKTPGTLDSRNIGSRRSGQSPAGRP